MTRVQRGCFGLLFAVFTWFTWRGMQMFFSGDDVMNMTGVWNLNAWRLGRAIPMFWMPVYRPLGGAVYRIFYAIWAFHPEPLYIFSWLLLALNVWLAFRFYRVLSGNVWAALAALAITLVHGSFQDLYLSAGTIYDRLCFLFTALGLTLYAEWRGEGRRVGVGRAAWICLVCLLAMDSKESGVAVVALLGVYELVFVVPGFWKSGRLRDWLRGAAPLFGVLGAMALAFVFLRVNRTWELNMNPAYKPHASLSLWLTRMGEYFGVLAYRSSPVGPGVTVFVLVAMVLAAVVLRNRAMAFGLAFFTLAITPVALISLRPGYVLYVPELGLGLYLGAFVFAVARRAGMPERWDGVAFAGFAAAAVAFHAVHWPPRFDPRILPELRLSEQLTRDYPEMPKGSRLLFVSDDFPRFAYDLMFTVRLHYGDKSIIVHRLEGPPDQRPEAGQPLRYDHVFGMSNFRYEELDNRNVEESIRLHILKRYTVGREMDMFHLDHAAYVVSGVEEGDGTEIGRWTAPKARLKFDVYPAAAVLTAKFWVPDFVAAGGKRVPDFVAAGGKRVLEFAVNGARVGTVPLTQVGMNEVSFPVAAERISRVGYTMVDLDVENPYKDGSGKEFGVILLRAGFGYPQAAK